MNARHEIKQASSKLPLNGRDVVGGVGLIMLGAGFYLVYPPLALIVPGALLFAVAVWRYVH